MTNQEAIEILKNIKEWLQDEGLQYDVKALENGIEALESQKSIIKELEKIQTELISCFSQENDIDSDPYNHALDIAISIVHDSIAELKGDKQ